MVLDVASETTGVVNLPSTCINDIEVASPLLHRAACSLRCAKLLDEVIWIDTPSQLAVRIRLPHIALAHSPLEGVVNLGDGVEACDVAVSAEEAS